MFWTNKYRRYISCIEKMYRWYISYRLLITIDIPSYVLFWCLCYLYTFRGDWHDLTRLNCNTAIYIVRGVIFLILCVLTSVTYLDVKSQIWTWYDVHDSPWSIFSISHVRSAEEPNVAFTLFNTKYYAHSFSMVFISNIISLICILVPECLQVMVTWKEH